MKMLLDSSMASLLLRTIKEFNQLSREIKERKVQEKLDNIKKDF